MFIRIYALAVCFATMMIIAISSGVALYDIVQASVPSLTINSWDYQNLQSNEAYEQTGMLNRAAIMAPTGAVALEKPERPDVEALSDEEITRLREAHRARVIEGHRRDALRSLIQAGIFLIISSVLFFVHWRLARRLDGA